LCVIGEIGKNLLYHVRDHLLSLFIYPKKVQIEESKLPGDSQLRWKCIRTLIAKGRNVPIHAAANTSVGQWTPSTSRESPTRNIHKKATIMTIPWDAGRNLRAKRVAAVANAATASV